MFVSIANAKKEACFTEIHPTAYASLRGRGNSFCTLVKKRQEKPEAIRIHSLRNRPVAEKGIGLVREGKNHIGLIPARIPKRLV